MSCARCILCLLDAGPSPFEQRIENVTIVLCPKCCGALVHRIIAYLKGRRATLFNPLAMTEAWEQSMKETEEQQRSPELPLAGQFRCAARMYNRRCEMNAGHPGTHQTPEGDMF